MGTDRIANFWDLEESPTLRLVGAYLDGVADAMAGLVQQPGAGAASPPLPSGLVEKAVDGAAASTPESTLEGAPGAPSSRHITLRFGEIALPVEASPWPRSAGDHLEPVRGGSRLLDLEHPSSRATYTTGGPWRETLPYSAPSLTVSPTGAVSIPSLWPEQERISGVRLQLPGLSPAWYALTGTD